MKPAIIIHGGPWRIPRDEHQAHRNGCRTAAMAGYEVLRSGGVALEAVETTATVLEDDPTFDAGTGSHLNQIKYDSGYVSPGSRHLSDDIAH